MASLAKQLCIISPSTTMKLKSSIHRMSWVMIPFSGLEVRIAMTMPTVIIRISHFSQTTASYFLINVDDEEFDPRKWMAYPVEGHRADVEKVVMRSKAMDLFDTLAFQKGIDELLITFSDGNLVTQVSCL
ncbi:hypothetical protein HPP92_026907 [Vanilla planifolia]|uniref:Uncharacterized protein n=1 Tax=Vanilla planifolia TaxID=51239 RepID=A0A835U5A6_VANPL|nr:hypothetical protein HPP92_027060 [Vanilla planifolia]KAG0450158.1 hypothetical protein HPP92_026907 [Vanilla planifolia]